MITVNEHNELQKMHECITENGMASFDTAYLERYAELLAKSLYGKGDSAPARSNHSLV